MEGLYPLKFHTIFKDKIWGGDKIRSVLNKDFGALPNCGESWELSGVQGNVSVVSNGYLAGNDLEELIEVYMGDLVGDQIFEKFGLEFPLLVKFIDAADDLSVQVHPNDWLAAERHQSNGKTEMWVVLQAEADSRLQIGFNQEVDEEKYLHKLEAGQLADILNFEQVRAGDAFFIPAGRVHAIGKGVLLAEIQQASDITYRIFDYNRRDLYGNLRELHTEEALEAIDYSSENKGKIPFVPNSNQSVELVKCDYFTTNLLEINRSVEKDYNEIDSFVIYLCYEGSVTINAESGSEELTKGEVILIPACIEHVEIKLNSAKASLLEVYIEQ